MRRSAILLATLLVLSLAATASGGQLMGRTTGHYMPGPNGVEGAMNPPAGSDTFAFALPNYSFDVSKDNNGNKTPSPTLSAFTPTARWIHMFEQGLFGGTTGFNIAVTGSHTDVSGAVMPHNQSFDRMGDPSGELMQGWMVNDVALRLRLGTHLGIGDYRKQDAVNYAKDFSSFYAQFGATTWFDKDHKLSATAIGTYETNTEMSHWKVRPGDDFTLEASLAYTLNDYVSIAASGYWQTQVNNDSGKDVGWKGTEKYSVAALGPYARFMLPFIKPGAMLHVTYWKEMNAKNHSEGNLFFSEFQIPF